MIKLNENMGKVIELLAGQSSAGKSESSAYSGKRIKVCSHCGAKNREEDYICRDCSEPI